MIQVDKHLFQLAWHKGKRSIKMLIINRLFWNISLLPDAVRAIHFPKEMPYVLQNLDVNFWHATKRYNMNTLSIILE